MRLLDDFSPFVLPYVVGCTTPMFEQALRSTAIEFCEKTDIVQQVVSTGVAESVGEYYVEVPADMLLARVMQVYYGQSKLSLIATTHVDIPFALRGSVDDQDPPSNTPLYAYQIEPGSSSFWLYPLPDRTDSTLLTVRASFSPSRDAAQLADVLYDNWVDPIAAGTIAHLMAMPGQPFTSPAAAEYRLRFLSGVASARAESRKGRTLSSTRVQPRNFCL